MAKITFVINESQPNWQRMDYLSHLLLVWFRRDQLPIFCLTPNQTVSNSLDTALWNTQTPSFLPHCIGKVHDYPPQVYIGDDVSLGQGAQTIFNCRTTPLEPNGAQEYIEFRCSVDKDRLRKLYKTYQQQSHDLSFIRT